MPPFQFTTSASSKFENKNRLAEIDFFLVHSIVLPESPQAKSHLLVSVKWPLIHPQRHYFGKPVEVWCSNVYEPDEKYIFLLASAISSRAIISIDSVSSENVCIAVPIIEV